MKKITIGRGRECDIRLDDSSDLVSRRQAVIRISPTGKMEIFDLSSNGTFVNGEKVEKPNGMPVKRGDQVNFAHVVDLDWDKVKDPYKTAKVSSVFVTIAVAAVVVVVVFFDQIFPPSKDKATEEITVVVPQEDTIVPPAPQPLDPAFANTQPLGSGQGQATRRSAQGAKVREKDNTAEQVNAPEVKEEYDISNDVRSAEEIRNHRKAGNN